MLLRTGGRLLRRCPWTLRPRIAPLSATIARWWIVRLSFLPSSPPPLPQTTKRVSSPLILFAPSYILSPRGKSGKTQRPRRFRKLLLEEICRDRSIPDNWQFVKWDRSRRAIWTRMFRWRGKIFFRKMQYCSIVKLARRIHLFDEWTWERKQERLLEVLVFVKGGRRRPTG